MDTIKNQLSAIMHPYYIVNIIMSLSFLASKCIQPLCAVVFNGNCEFEGRQHEILFFLLMIVMMRARKTGSMTFVSYLNNSFVYCKIANMVLWFLTFKLYGLVYMVLFFAQAMLLPQPTYKGPQHILYFRDAKTFKEETAKENNTVWLIEFYTAWNPACVNFAPIFSELSAKYHLDNFKFGKVDLARFPEVGADFRISDSAFSKQLPTIILFKDGKPVMFRPNWDASGKLNKFHMNMDNIVVTFGLNDVYRECKELLQKQKSTKKIHPKSE